MILGKRWLFSIGNGAEIWPLEMGRKPPADFVADQPSHLHSLISAILIRSLESLVSKIAPC